MAIYDFSQNPLIIHGTSADVVEWHGLEAADPPDPDEGDDDAAEPPI